MWRDILMPIVVYAGAMILVVALLAVMLSTWTL